MTKTVQQLVDEYRNRLNPKIRTLIIKAGSNEYVYKNVSNLRRVREINKIMFDTLTIHVKIYGQIILKEEEL